ncbi:DNA-directed DNA polymerase epsilon, subunit B [Coemansia sp. RSA 1813]|nr:DNA-directed DNA polymerase epsilon, subunit B [Coemansia sp. RSA 1843]KAJ2092068.1 DNA-directed DNA polymerase epsilon, subunit B [Coemansia sp. RSA 986]KAJ2216596.1 DNA-directed DNA polymerase epsilon, subunit B [Coemansia sp. RSA 487]KAJ2572121.1 DNA-directed DNA polymerase epsilon, subunit B [Coemansia sp. RSA 1813]
MQTERPLVQLDPLKELVAAVAAGTDNSPTEGASAGNGTTSSTAQAAASSDLFSVISAYDIPPWWYDPGKKMFIHPFDKAEILSSAEAKAALFRQRYDLIKQRVMRNENFMPISFSDQEKDRFYKLSSIDSLQGRDGEHFLLFGMLSQLEEGKLFLEDKAGSIELDFSEMKSKHASVNGLFTESCFVLVDGYVEDAVFMVEEIGLPPPETKGRTRSAFPNVNFFGGNPSLRTESQLRAIEVSNDNGMIVLSDVWLDQQDTMDALRTLFEGFSHSTPPIAFIFIGDFSSKPFVAGSGDTAKYRDNMTALGQLIGSFPDIARKSHFIFVPGINDPWGQGALPKPPLAEFFTKRLASRLSKVTFATNPCHIKYCTHEIVVFREDLLKRIRRNSVLPPTESTEIAKHLVRTVIDQGHLCPLPQRIRPIYWAYDHSMRVYPIPDVLILADRFDSYSINYEGAQCINPGSFSAGDFSFFMYYPVSRTAQYSKIPRRQ